MFERDDNYKMWFIGGLFLLIVAFFVFQDAYQGMVSQRYEVKPGSRSYISEEVSQRENLYGHAAYELGRRHVYYGIGWSALGVFCFVLGWLDSRRD